MTHLKEACMQSLIKELCLYCEHIFKGGTNAYFSYNRITQYLTVNKELTGGGAVKLVEMNDCVSCRK
jgi:hypothetical protein